MTISRIYVWVFPSHASVPRVAGVVRRQGQQYTFTYAKSYLLDSEAVPLGPDLPLLPGRQIPAPGLDLHGTLRDALPDAWGQRVLLDRATGRRGVDADLAELGFDFYMLESDSQRFGNLDFQPSHDIYEPRGGDATLDDLAQAADLLDRGQTLPANLDAALLHGTSVGGARPKAQLRDREGQHWIAKFSSSTDRLPTVQIEAAALFLAKELGLEVPQFRLERAVGKQVLLVKRFDRQEDCRLATVSMLTVLGLNEMTGRYASYTDFLDRLELDSSGRLELFRRVALNIAIGNVDDHARNHAAFWDGTALRLAPVYDLDPTSRPGGWDSNQAIAFSREGTRQSNLSLLLAAASDYGLSLPVARDAIDQIVHTVETTWTEAADFAQLSVRSADLIRERAILHPSCLEVH